MTNYIARVELKGAVPEDCERLNLSMQQRGNARKIAGEDGVIYKLPTGTYFVTDTSAGLEVALQAAVGSRGRNQRGIGSYRKLELCLMEWAGEGLSVLIRTNPDVGLRGVRSLIVAAPVGVSAQWNANDYFMTGQIRITFPKRMDLSGFSQSELDKVAQRLNQRPRKTLGFETPASRLQASVASTH
jgi:hypothetical protein